MSRGRYLHIIRGYHTHLGPLQPNRNFEKSTPLVVMCTCYLFFFFPLGLSSHQHSKISISKLYNFIAPSSLIRALTLPTVYESTSNSIADPRSTPQNSRAFPVPAVWKIIPSKIKYRKENNIIRNLIPNEK